jgi:FkbM family methyltransferase
MRRAADVGCGIGHFSKFLRELGFEVVGIDGREENVREAEHRYANIEFHQANIEDDLSQRFGTFDLVFCMGLLYHLENPFLAIRRLRVLAKKVLLIESMCLPDSKPWMLLREEPRAGNQSLTNVAFYSSEGCLVKMLYRAGFSAVYRFAVLPNHDDFQETSTHSRRRVILLALFEAVSVAGLVPVPEPPDVVDPWQKPVKTGTRGAVNRVRRFLHRPFHEQSRSFYARWVRIFPGIPIPVRLPFGAWFMARNDGLGSTLSYDGFETRERNFVMRFLREGMIVLDIGAHQGFYTLLASKLVGPAGKVFAFEPSPREQKALRLNLILNGCNNVSWEAMALGDAEAQADLYVVNGKHTGFNSLRPPGISGPTTRVKVKVKRLDDWLRETKVDRADFIKLDVEGGEFAALKGAAHFLEQRPRPVILAELEDARSEPWGLRAKDTANLLQSLGFQWFTLLLDGTLKRMLDSSDKYEGNFVAVPKERMREFTELTEDGSRS